MQTEFDFRGVCTAARAARRGLSTALPRYWLGLYGDDVGECLPFLGVMTAALLT